MKKLWLLILCFCSIILTAADPYFKLATANVDLGGEMLMYQNITALMRTLNTNGPDIIVQAISRNNISPQERLQYQQVVNFIFKLLDFESFNAIAASSNCVSPDLYVYKSAVLIKPGSKSVLFADKIGNVKQNWKELPVDTRIAFACELDIAAIWQKISAAAAASNDPQIKSLLTSAAELQQQGIDINGICHSLKGHFSLLIAGNNADTLGFKFELPDHNGELSKLLKTFIPPMQSANKADVPLPMPSGAIPQLIYNPGKIVFVSDTAMMESPAQKIGALPKFAKFAKYLPTDGKSYLLIDMPQPVIDMINVLSAMNPDMPKFMLKPFSLVMIERKIPAGTAAVITSDFSLMQLQATLPLFQIQQMIPNLHKKVK